MFHNVSQSIYIDAFKPFSVIIPLLLIEINTLRKRNNYAKPNNPANTKDFS